MLWFGREVWPRVIDGCAARAAPDRGHEPASPAGCAARRAQVEITGAVPDVRPYLRDAAAYVIPMRVGGGTRYKALEAMATARPIVSTSLGVEGIDVAHERELLIADSAPAFAAAVTRLAADRAGDGALARRLGASARAFVTANYAWERIIPTIEQVHADCRSRGSVNNPSLIVPGTSRNHRGQSRAEYRIAWPRPSPLGRMT